MKKNKIVWGGLLMAILGLGLAGTTMAYQGDSTKKGPNYTVERENQITEVMNKADYEGWKKLMNGKGMVTKVVNKDNFPKFVEAWKLSKDGKTIEADAIRKELGLKTSTDTRGNMHGQGNGQNKNRMKNNHGLSFVDKNNDGVCDNQKINN